MQSQKYKYQVTGNNLLLNELRMLQRSGNLFLRPVSSVIVQSAGRKRGPPRFLGKTKTQYLDWLMRSNANICALISFSFFPLVGWYSYRYFTVLKPARDAKQAQEEADLLAEGKAIA